MFPEVRHLKIYLRCILKMRNCVTVAYTNCSTNNPNLHFQQQVINGCLILSGTDILLRTSKRVLKTIRLWYFFKLYQCFSIFVKSTSIKFMTLFLVGLQHFHLDLTLSQLFFKLTASVNIFYCLRSCNACVEVNLVQCYYINVV